MQAYAPVFFSPGIWKLTNFFSMVDFRILFFKLHRVDVFPGSYILQVSAFVAALISLMTGTSVLIIYDTCYANTDMKRILRVCHLPFMHSSGLSNNNHQSLKRSRLRLVCSLILMAYPSLALAVSTLALLTGLSARPDLNSVVSKAFSAVFIAGFTSDKLFVKILTAVTYLTLVLLGVLALYVFSAPWIE
jgi:hypothetical protein